MAAHKLFVNAITFFALILFGFISPTFAGELVYSQLSDGLSTEVSYLAPDASHERECSDDFYLIGTIDRVYLSGYTFNFPAYGFAGVRLRFYQATANNTPGALQAEYTLYDGDPNLQYDNGWGSWFDITLPTPFPATGKHFIAFQPIIGMWEWWSAPHTGSPMYFRSNSGTWFAKDRGLAFLLYGFVSGPGTIQSLSPTTQTRSGFLEILGVNFGNDGQVMVGGFSAPIASWTNTRIIAYVPEATPLGTASLQVITAGGLSNTTNLSVTARQLNGRVRWRLRFDSLYSFIRPALGPDGTIYVVDVHGRLYAITPDGAVKWIVRGAGAKGCAVGQDGTIYVGSESNVKAYYPDGTLKWDFVQNPRAFILLGIAVGPDGNIYGVATSGMGVFSLTPTGTLRWKTPEAYSRPITDYGEIVFGLHNGEYQMYFYANAHLRAVRLRDGASIFIAGGGQPAVSPLDQTVHTRNTALTSAGQLLWSFFPSSGVLLSGPAVAFDGTHYLSSSTSLYALNPGGAELWRASLGGTVGTLTVDSANRLVFMGSNSTLNNQGFVQTISTISQSLAWRVDLPAEEPQVFNPWTGLYGFNQFVTSGAKFAPDNGTVYVHAAIATGGLVRERCFLYAFDANVTTSTPPPPPPPTTLTKLRSASITLTGKVSSNIASIAGSVLVRDQSDAAVAGATVSIRWRFPNGTTQSQTAITDSAGVARFSARGSRGTYTLTVTGITKSGYTFDSASSVLSKSITM